MCTCSKRGINSDISTNKSDTLKSIRRLKFMSDKIVNDNVSYTQ